LPRRSPRRSPLRSPADSPRPGRQPMPLVNLGCEQPRRLALSWIAPAIPRMIAGAINDYRTSCAHRIRTNSIAKTIAPPLTAPIAGRLAAARPATNAACEPWLRATEATRIVVDRTGEPTYDRGSDQRLSALADSLHLFDLFRFGGR